MAVQGFDFGPNIATTGTRALIHGILTPRHDRVNCVHELYATSGKGVGIIPHTVSILLLNCDLDISELVSLMLRQRSFWRKPDAQSRPLYFASATSHEVSRV